MIGQLSGKVIQKKDNLILVDVGGVCYEVLIPQIILDRIDKVMEADKIIRLITYHYLASEPSKSIPVLIGFLDEIEKEFFEKFITVSGIGPKAALRALSEPISVIAQAIDRADARFLSSLPGIGPQRAKEIIARLQGKVGKFGLMKDAKDRLKVSEKEDLEQEALQVLIHLQYKKKEALDMIHMALSRAPQVSTVEELLNEVYRQKKR
ncbi:MAG: Holliday junction branch migration protein RuvA [Candidatus Omnitrophota bacterium]